jgi:hypothetical protein
MSWQILYLIIGVSLLGIGGYVFDGLIDSLVKMVVRFKKKPPEDWWTYHTKDCGTKYRGCSPDCPKDIYERTGEWRT